VRTPLIQIIETASYADMQKIRIIGFIFEHRLHWRFEIRLLLLAISVCV